MHKKTHTHTHRNNINKTIAASVGVTTTTTTIPARRNQMERGGKFQTVNPSKRFFFKNRPGGGFLV
jgi:hypothetical protein